MSAAPPLRAAGATDRGLQRTSNEDQFHVDVGRGLFMVIDGVGGQAAGGQAAGVALAMLRARLERETGPTSERVREAIAVANNEIHRLAATRPEWTGMACVLTVALVKDGLATIGHVGDTRLYKLRRGSIEKITRDHSPVGEREDAGELSESDAMHHPRRNEVYRDVGSEPHDPDDPDFVELATIPFEDEAALLLCSDGLTDLVPAAAIERIVEQLAGDPSRVVHALVEAANEAGGKDNVTVVYVEGRQFASALPGAKAAPRQRTLQPVRVALVCLLVLLGLFLAFRPQILKWLGEPTLIAEGPPASSVQHVEQGGSIADALARALPGSEIVVAPGEYRERIVLKEHVRVISLVPRGATIRLPADASEGEAAVIAEDLARADLVGFRILGDAATPLGTGVRVSDAAVAIVDLEIVGATRAAVEFVRGSGDLIGSELRDNPGAALVVRSGAFPRIAHNVFGRNGTSEHAAASFAIEGGARPRFEANVFRGVGADAFVTLDRHARALLARDNWFVGPSRQGHER